MPPTRTHQPRFAGAELPSVEPRAPILDPAAVPPAPAREPRRSRGVAVASTTASTLGLLAAAALVEWLGWQIVWRHHHASPTLDEAWRLAYASGVMRNLTGALGVGAVLALLGGVSAVVVPRWRPRARRIALTALGLGAATFLGFLGALTRLAP